MFASTYFYQLKERAVTLMILRLLIQTGLVLSMMALTLELSRAVQAAQAAHFERIRELVELADRIAAGGHF